MSNQMKKDLKSLVNAYKHGGKEAANQKFSVIVKERRITQWEALVLSDAVKFQLQQEGAYVG